MGRNRAEAVIDIAANADGHCVVWFHSLQRCCFPGTLAGFSIQVLTVSVLLHQKNSWEKWSKAMQEKKKIIGL